MHTQVVTSFAKRMLQKLEPNLVFWSLRVLQRAGSRPDKAAN